MLKLPIYKVLLTALASFMLVNVHGQENLISNWSFEKLQPNNNGDTICPNSGGHVYLSKYWKSADGSVDYFNACSNDEWPNYGIPQNVVGFQEGYDGEAYALIGGYADLEGYEDAREFLFQELSDSLKRGQGYYWETHVSLADSVNFAMSRLGALFTLDDTRYWQDDDFFNTMPQIETPFDTLLSDKENWIQVSGHFVAEGGEKFMTIGFFKRDIDENIVRVDNIPQGFYTWDLSAYYIDGVELYEDNSIGIAENQTIRTNLYPNPSNGEGITLEYAMRQNATVQWEIKDMAGRTVHVQPLLGNEDRAILGMSLPAGVYISAVVAGGVRMVIEKLVVQ